MSGGQQTRREADKTSGSIAKIGTTATRTQGHVNRLAGSLTHGLVGAAAIGFGAVATGLVLGTRKGLAFNATIENSVARFGVFTKNAAEAKRLFGDIQTLNTKSTFGLGELAGATAYLGNAGLQVSKLPETMAGLANAVAAAGGGNDELQRAAVALGQMAQNGVASREELNQLTEAGVSVGFLREELGLSAKEYKNLGDQGIESGKVIDILIKNWTSGKIGKAAAAQAKTFSGQWSNLGDQLDQILGAATKPFFDLLRDNVFPQLLTWGNKFIAIFDPRFDFADNLKLALDLFAHDIVPTVVDELGNLVDQAKAAGLDKDLGKLLGDGVDAATPQIGTALGKAFEVAIPVAWGALVGAIKENPEDLIPLIGAAAMWKIGPETIGGLVSKGKGKDGGAAGAALDLFGDRGTAFNPFYVIEIDKPRVKPPVVVPGGKPGGGGGLKGTLKGGFKGLLKGSILGAIAYEGANALVTQVPGFKDIYDALGKQPTSKELITSVNRKALGPPGTHDFPDTSEMTPTPQGFNFTIPLYVDGKEIARANHREVRRKEAQR
jgi:tape measure domain-containing protein